MLMMANPKPSGFANTKAGRAVIYERAKQLTSESSMIMVVPIAGVKKNDIDILRKSLPSGTKATVLKNGIFRKALEQTKFEGLNPHLTQENMYFFVPEGLYKETLAAFKKWQGEIERREEEHNVKLVCLDGTIYEKSLVDTACSIPSRKEVMGRFVRVLKAIPQRLSSSINSVPRELVLTLDAVNKKREGSEQTATA